MSSEAMNIIGGEYKRGSTDKVRERRNPATGEVFSTFTESTTEEVDDAIEAAKYAFENSDWGFNPKLRTKVLREINEAVIKNFDYICETQSAENGKVLSDSEVEVRATADFFDFYAGLARLVTGKTHLPDANIMSFVIREPMGIIGIIVPWNAPIVLLARSLAPALAAGNTIIIKPPSFTPYCVYALIDIIHKEVKDLPKGVINVVLGSGETVGNELARHEDVDFISFTGSTEAGAKVMQEAGMNIKKLSLELGGKTPNIILGDADFESAINGAIKGSMLGSAGQICFAGTRIMVHDSIYDKFRKGINDTVPKMRIGNGLDKNVDIGPLVSRSQLKNVMGYIEEGKKVSDILVGGNLLDEGEYANGNFVEPTIFDDVPPDSKIAREEIFGPVVSLIRFKDFDVISQIANDTKYGLSAAIWTNNIKDAFKLARSIRAGVVWINMYGKMYPEAETGTFKQSGIGGTLRGEEALNTFTEIKSILLNVN